MTYEQWVSKAIRAAELSLYVPPGWWGVYRKVQSRHGDVVVQFSGVGWTLRKNGVLISRHDSREFAISKGRKLERG